MPNCVSLAGAFQEIVADLFGRATAVTFVGAPDSSALAGEVANVMLPVTIDRISATLKNKFAREILKYIVLCWSRCWGLENVY
jgi:hypothetical protein